MRIIMVLFLFFLSSEISSLEYGILAKRNTSVPIKQICLYSERCSGSNYTQKLILDNFQSLRLAPKSEYGFKHFSPWFDLPIEVFHGPESWHTLENNENTLFIILFRDPYDWLRSFHTTPNHAHKKIKSLLFSDFIKTPWKLDPQDNDINFEKRLNPLIDKDPSTGKNFANVMHLRSAKIKNMLLVEKKVENAYYINYETIRDHPKKVLEEIKNIFGLTLKEDYTPVIRYKGFSNTDVYRPKKYYPINNKDLKYINSQLNKDLENLIGYELKDAL